MYILQGHLNISNYEVGSVDFGGVENGTFNHCRVLVKRGYFIRDLAII